MTLSVPDPADADADNAEAVADAADAVAATSTALTAVHITGVEGTSPYRAPPSGAASQLGTTSGVGTAIALTAGDPAQAAAGPPTTLLVVTGVTE